MRIRSGGSITIDGRTFTGDVVIDRNGNVSVNGNVEGGISTMSGDVTCGNVSGGVSTISGDIIGRR